MGDVAIAATFTRDVVADAEALADAELPRKWTTTRVAVALVEPERRRAPA